MTTIASRLLRPTKTKIVLLTLLVLTLIVRAIAPAMILSKLNEKLANSSPVYSMHIGDLDLGLLTFSYRFGNIESFYKRTGEKFFDLKTVRVQISFRELLHGRILTNVEADEGHFILTKAILNSKDEPDAKLKETTMKTSDALFPVRIAVVKVHRSSFDFADFVTQDQKTRWRVSEIEAKFFNINPLPGNPYTSFDAKGNLLGTSPFSIIGKAKRLDKPMGWKIDIEMKDFSLPIANHILYRDVPFTFMAGTLDLYGEAKSEKGQISGYVKPFLKSVKILNSKEKLKNLKHFFFEIIGAFGNWVLKNSDTKTTATKIAFHEEGGHLKVDIGDALQAALKNKFDKPLTPGTDDSVPFK